MNEATNGVLIRGGEVIGTAISIDPTAAERLKSFLERLEQLDIELTDKKEDIKEVYAEVKSEGFETKILRKIVAERKKTREAREEERSLFELYTDGLAEAGVIV